MTTNKEKLGLNRTGIQTAPLLSKEMEEASNTRGPIPAAGGEELARVRVHYSKGGARIGSITPPATLKGAVKAAFAALEGNRPMSVIDKLGERLAFERSGARLYEALLSKYDAFGSWDGGPTREELQRIGEDELVHFHLVRWAILKLGGDPTMVTPAADIIDTTCSGMRVVLGDPRADLRQSLAAIHVTELADNDAWPVLIALVGPVDQEIAQRFEEALTAEARHLSAVRSWLIAATGVAAGEVLPRLAPRLYPAGAQGT